MLDILPGYSLPSESDVEAQEKFVVVLDSAVDSMRSSRPETEIVAHFDRKSMTHGKEIGFRPSSVIMEYGFFEEIKLWKMKIVKTDSPVPDMNLMGRVIMAFMPITLKAFVRFFLRRYVAGTDLHQAIKVMKDMANKHVLHGRCSW